MREDILKIFALGGPLARATGGRYELREGQLQMATEIDDVFDSGGHLLVEAPTGTGKSVAYLVPAIRQAVANRRRTVVVTANIALQEQLMAKDLPSLDAALPELPFTYALAKGLGNYLCRANYENAFGDRLLGHQSQDLAFDFPAVRDPWEAIAIWSDTTTTGDLSELDIELPPNLKRAVTSTADDCTGRKCRHHETCWGLAARRALTNADIVVTNYHLFFADLNIKGQEGQGILPPYDFVVFDEAHAAADIARDFFGWRTTFGAVKWATRLLKDQAQQATLLRHAERLFQTLGRDRVSPRIKQPGEVQAEPLAGLLDAAAQDLNKAAALELVPEAKKKLEQGANRSATIAMYLRTSDNLERGSDLVYYADPPATKGGNAALGMKPIKVGPTLEKILFQSKKIKAIVGTSATLAVGGDFDFIAEETGCYGADELVVPSPFDHRGAAVLIVPTDLPDPRHAAFAERVSEIVIEAATRARGRTLALFTSNRVLDAAHRALVATNPPYRVLRQGDAPRTKLVDEFRRDVSSVLLGTDSFWEGIDVQGEALSCVVIDRLPFDHPDDPVMDAICEKYPRGWFGQYSLPRSILGFRQGFGRLIRSRTDRGAIVVCDRRIVDKPYGSQYVRALPLGVTLERSLGAIGRILG